MYRVSRRAKEVHRSQRPFPHDHGGSEQAAPYLSKLYVNACVGSLRVSVY
jgi:hypothetical protein